METTRYYDATTRTATSFPVKSRHHQPSVMSLGLVHSSNASSEKMWSLRWYAPLTGCRDNATGPARGGSFLKLPPTVTHCRVGKATIKAPCATPAAALAGVAGGDAAVDVSECGRRDALLWSWFVSVRVVPEISIRLIKPSSVSTKGGRTLTVQGAFPSSDSIACLFDDIAVPAQRAEKISSAPRRLFVKRARSVSE